MKITWEPGDLFEAPNRVTGKYEVGLVLTPTEALVARGGNRVAHGGNREAHGGNREALTWAIEPLPANAVPWTGRAGTMSSSVVGAFATLVKNYHLTKKETPS